MSVRHDIAMRFFLGNLIWSKQFKNVKQLELVFCNAMSSNLYYILELQYHLLKYNIIRCLHIQYYCTCTIIIQHCSRSLIKKKLHKVWLFKFREEFFSFKYALEWLHADFSQLMSTVIWKVYIIYISLTFHKRHLNSMSLSINLYFKSRFPSFLPFNSSNWGPAAARWKYSFVLCHRPETCVIVYVNRNHMGHFVLPVKKRGNSASK